LIFRLQAWGCVEEVLAHVFDLAKEEVDARARDLLEMVEPCSKAEPGIMTDLKLADRLDDTTLAPGERRQRSVATPARVRFETIYGEIRDRICLLRYPPGHTLGECELAREFGISRTPIRRVLQRLEHEGLVESRQGIGTIVTLIDLEELREIDDLRMKLAEISGEMTPLPRTRADVDRMKHLLERCRKIRSGVDQEEFGRLNIAVQQELSSSIGNLPLRDISDRLFFQTTRMWLQLLPLMSWPEEVDAFSNEIADLIQAMELNDLRSLHFIRRNHISMSRLRMKGYFGQ
jgi:DNA-binding GntR family transcriptional regulator